MSISEDSHPTAPLPPHLRSVGADARPRDAHQSAIADSVVPGLAADPMVSHRSYLGAPAVTPPRGVRPADDDLDATSHPEFDGEVPAPTPQPHSELNRFKLLRVVGRGGMGEIWEAVQLRLRRVVAVKRMARLRLGSTGGGSSTRVDVFQNEAVTAGLLDHPNIVPVYELAYEDNGVPALAMKFVRGSPWIDLIREDFDALDVDAFLARHLNIFAQVCQAVSFAHSRGIIHRDLKPSQVMIGDFGEVLLMDWGLAVIVERTADIPDVEFDDQDRPVNLPRVETAENPAGTPAFMAPEQTESKPTRLGYHTDVYLLGGILYQLLTGRAPHEADTGAQAWRLAERGYVKPVGEAARERRVPEALGALAMRALVADPVQRMQSAREFHHQLTEIMSGSSRRNEATKIVAEVRREYDRGVREYADCQRLLAALDEAMALWPDVPGGAAMKDGVLHRYGVLALVAGDVGVARAAGRAMGDGERKSSLLSEADDVERKRERTRRRLRAAALAVTALVAAILIGGTYSYLRISTQAGQIRVQLDKTEAERSRAVAAESSATDRLASSLMNQAIVLIEQNRLEAARAALWQVPEPLRNWEWGYALARAHPTLAERDVEMVFTDGRRDRIYGVDPEGRCVAMPLLGRGPTEVLEADFQPTGYFVHSSSGAWIATATPSGALTIWSGERLQPKTRIDVGTGFDSWTMAISDDPPRLAIAYRDGTVRVWDAIDGTVLAELQEFGTGTKIINFSDDGERMIVAGGVNVYAYSLSSRRVIYSRRLKTSVLGAAISPSGRDLVWSETEDTFPPAALVNLDTGVERTVDLYGSTFVFHEASRTLLAADSMWSRRAASIVNLDSGEVRSILHRLDKPTACAISDRGDRVLIGSPERVGVWDARSLELLREVPVYEGDLSRAAFGFRGRLIVTASSSRHTKAWDAYSASTGATIEGSYPSIPDGGRSAISLGWSWGEMTDLDTGLRDWMGGWAFNPYRGICPWPDRKGATAVGVTSGAAFTIQSVASSDFRTVAETHLDFFPSNIYRDDPGGRLFLRDEATSSVLVFDTRSARQLGKLDLNGELEGSLLTAVDALRGRVFMLTPEKAYVTVGVDGAGPPRPEFEPGMKYRGLRLLDGADLCATISAEGDLAVWNLATRALAARIPGKFDPIALFFSPDGAILGAVAANGDCTVANATDGSIISQFSIPAPASPPRCKVLPGNKRILIRVGEAARVVDLASGEETASWRSGFGDVSANGEWVLQREGDLRWGVTRVAPYREPDIHGTAGESWRDRHGRWQREQRDEWILRSPMRQLPTAIIRLRAFDDRDVATAVPLIAKSWAVSHAIRDLMPHEEEAALQLNDLWGRMGMRDVPGAVCPFDIDRSIGVLLRAESNPAWVESPGTALNALLLLEYLNRTEESKLETQSARRRDYQPLAETFAALGEEAAAIQVYARATVMQRLIGSGDASFEQELERLGGPPPPAPPSDLVIDAQGLTEGVRQLVAEMDAEHRPAEDIVEAARSRREADLARAFQFLNEVAPLDEVHRAAARLRARHEAKLVPGTAKLREVAREAEDAAERAVLGGITWAEAEAECQTLIKGNDAARP